MQSVPLEEIISIQFNSKYKVSHMGTRHACAQDHRVRTRGQQWAHALCSLHVILSVCLSSVAGELGRSTALYCPPNPCTHTEGVVQLVAQAQFTQTLIHMQMHTLHLTLPLCWLSSMMRWVRGSSALKQTTSIRSHTREWSFRWAVRRAGSHVATPLAHLLCMWAGVPRYIGLSQDGETEPRTWETWNGIRKESWAAVGSQ